MKPSEIGPYKVKLLECPYCRESLRVVALADGREVATERVSGEEHVCWDMPDDADLLVLGD